MLQSLLDTENWYWFCLLAYLLGSIPFGLLITRYFLGYDVRTQGSGNIGMTNVMRTGGKWPGIATFLLDFGKGFLPVVLAQTYLKENNIEWMAICGGLSVLGHTRSIFLKFKGGKGVATNFGFWAALDWRVFVVMGLLWLGMFLWKKVSSLAALISLSLFPWVVLYLHGAGLVTGVAFLLALYLLFLHHSNIRRLMGGQEKKLVG